MKSISPRSAASTFAIMTSFLCGCGQVGGESIDEAPGQAVDIQAAQARTTTLRPSVDLVGTLTAMPEATVELSTQVEGQVKDVPVLEGHVVHAGDEIVFLDDRIARAAVAKANAKFQEARAVLALLKKGTRPEEIEAARQDLLKAKAAVQARRRKVAALAPLHDSREVSEVRFNEAKTDLDAANAEYEARLARLKVLEAGSRPEEIAAAEARAALADAEVTAQELNVNLLTITSPIDGVITNLPVREGMFVSPSTTLVTVMNLDTLFAQVLIPTTYLPDVRPGAAVEVGVPALRREKLAGKLARIGPKASPLTGNVTAYISVPNPDGQLRPGLVCRVRVALPEIADALVIPLSAIADRAGTYVVTVIRNDKAYETEVQVGAQTAGEVQIAGGISDGDIVAVKGGYGLPDGCPVRITERLTLRK